MKKIIIIIFVLVFSLSLNAQDKNRIEIIAKIKKGSVVLRWSPSNKEVWFLANKFGYRIERYELIDKGKKVKNPKSTLETFGNKIFLLKPLDEWKSYIEKDNEVKMAAGLIYGDDMQETNPGNDVFSIIEQSKLQDTRYTYSILVAARNSKVADLMGLYYVDNTVDTNKKYLYRVYTLIPDSILAVDTGFVFVPANEYTQNAKISDIQVSSVDSLVSLSWNIKGLDFFYSGFYIERAIGDTNFVRLNDVPFVKINNGLGKNDENIITFKDLVPVLNIPVHYRIKGLDYFGEYGPYSEEISITPHPVLSEVPIISGLSNIDTLVLLTWNFPKEFNKDISKFYVKYSSEINGNYTVIDSVSSEIRLSKLNPKNESNFYIITAIDKYNQEYNSMPKMIILKDSTPPQPPTEITGNIDTAGIVRIVWKNNEENDLYGYKIYYANNPNNEFSELTKSFVYGNNYEYKISLNFMTSKIYYKLVAFDLHYNPSDFSEIVALIKPDTIPPDKPLIRNLEETDTALVLIWTPSYSQDVKEHEILRTIDGEENWEVIYKFGNEKISKIITSDRNVEVGVEYNYKIIAIDEAGNKSESHNILSGKLTKLPEIPQINKFSAKFDEQNGGILLKWNIQSNDINKIILYKKCNEEKFYSFKELNFNSFVDKNIMKGNIYSYKLRVLFKDGRSTPFSEIKSVNF